MTVQPPNFRPEVILEEPYPVVVRVHNAEEKGSDVNLGAHLVQDAYLERYDQAVIVTNDTDLLEPMRIVIEDVGKPVGLLTPVNKPSEKLKELSSFLRHITVADARACQFPDRVAFGRKGKSALKPVSW